MHSNAALITRFYTALSRLDGAAMAAQLIEIKVAMLIPALSIWVA